MEFDFQQIVDAAANRVQNQYNVFVSPQARAVLVSRAGDNAANVAAMAARDGLTTDDLIDAAEKQLREGLSHMAPQSPPQQQYQQQQQQQQYDGDSDGGGGGFGRQQQQQPRTMQAGAVQAGTKSKCWFMPWC